MKIRGPAPIVILLTVFITGCYQQGTTTGSNANMSRNAPTATPDEFASARATFAKECQTCHGPTGSGGPVKLEDGTKLKVPSLREGHALRHTDSDFVKQINKGGEGMPAFHDKLTPPQIDELVRFVRHEFQAGAKSPAK